MRLAWVLVGMVVLSGVAGAQVVVQQKRADGEVTALMTYGVGMVGGVCSPVAVLSHGAGGSEKGLAYLGAGLAKDGWLAVVPGHKESGMDVAAAEIAAKGDRRAGVQALVATPGAYVARLEDVGAALDWAGAQCTAKVRPFRALLGHSMGAETVMLEAGAKDNIKVGAAAGQDRFDAYVAMSPQGPGSVFLEGAWKSVAKPMFVLTGTLDAIDWRPLAYAGLPGGKGCDWEGIVDGASHASFGGHGAGQDAMSAEIVGVVEGFLGGVRRGSCSLPNANVAGLHLVAK